MLMRMQILNNLINKHNQNFLIIYQILKIHKHND
jgi:hypothetical protein